MNMFFVQVSFLCYYNGSYTLMETAEDFNLIFADLKEKS